MQEAKTRIQNKATSLWKAHGSNGILAMATGTGKSKIFVDEVKRLAKQYDEGVFVLSVPTRKLKDKNWKEEFEKWDALEIWETRVVKTCYASLHKIKNLDILLFGADECHRMTPRNEPFFQSNKIDRKMLLTATMPDDSSYTTLVKNGLFRSHGLKTVFTYTLLEAFQDKVVADVDITILTLDLNNEYKYLTTATRPIRRVTESEWYESISRGILFEALRSTSSNSFLRNRRASGLRDFRSKNLVAHDLISQLKGRYIVFCGSKDQCNFVVGNKGYYSGSGDDAFNNFVNLDSDILGAIKALNEGHSLPLVDGVFIVDMTTKLRDFIQRVGRAIRYRDNFKAKAYILTLKDTVEYDWTIRVLKQSKLNYKIAKLNPEYVERVVKEGFI